jgi:hypothetical protein
MYLATVTCNRDFQQMLLQAESIEKFVEPCSHIIIINEDQPDLEFWNRWLSPYYKNHKLTIIPRISYYYPTTFLGLSVGQNLSGDSSSNGWRTQQLQKLLLAYEFEDDYLLLDSKNFFIRKTNINEWENIPGSGAVVELRDEDYFTLSSKIYSKILNSPIEYYFKPQTPFKINKESLISKCKISELAYLLFYPEFEGHPATEGIFYSHFIKDEIIKFRDSYNIADKNYTTLWIHNRQEIDRILFDISSSDKIKVAGIHRELLSKLDEKELQIINFWITSDNPKFGLGLKNKIYPMPRDSYV